jgi:tRNA pseudouridine-54 N-methylase
MAFDRRSRVEELRAEIAERVDDFHHLSSLLNEAMGRENVLKEENVRLVAACLYVTQDELDQLKHDMKNHTVWYLKHKKLVYDLIAHAEDTTRAAYREKK